MTRVIRNTAGYIGSSTSNILLFFFVVIDVLRLMALNESAAKVMSNMRDALGQLLVHHGNKKAPAPNQLMVVRFFANLFRWDFFREFLLQYSDRVRIPDNPSLA